MKPVRIGVVGLGGRGRHWVRVFQSIPGCRVVAVCEKFEHRLNEGLKALDSDVKAYRDHNEMLRDAAIDAVGVVTAPLEQPEVAVAALESGRHVITEVPLSYDLDHCWDVLLAVERTGLTFRMAEQLRYWGVMQAWQRLVREGTLGEILYAQGEYIAYYNANMYFKNPKTGEYIPEAEVDKHPEAVRVERGPIHSMAYAVHEMSPMLSVLDDRVEVVTGMATPTPSRTHPKTERADYDMTMMKTQKGTVLREIVGWLNPFPPKAPHHWYQLVGSKGIVESPRAGWDKYRLWLSDSMMTDYAAAPWQTEVLSGPATAARSGHGGADWYPLASFVETVQTGKSTVEERFAPGVSPMDIYLAVEASAPGIVGGISIGSGGMPYRVPDFRPGPARAVGKEPADRRARPVHEGEEPGLPRSPHAG